MELVKKFQAGGAAPDQSQSSGTAQDQSQQGGASQQQGGGQVSQDQIMQMAQAIISQIGPEAADALAQALEQMIQSNGGGGGAAQQAPSFQRKGGKLVRVN